MLAYISKPRAEAMDMHLDVSYIPCDTSLKEHTSNIITFVQFEYRDLWSETCDDAVRGDVSDDDSIMPPLLFKEEMDAMNYGNKSDNDPMSMQMLEDINGGSQYNLNVNSRESHYRIRDHSKQIKPEKKRA